MTQRELFQTGPYGPAPADVCSNKHGGAPTSVDAFARAAATLSERRAQVLGVIRGAGRRGATMAEVAASMGVQLNTISGRGSDLKALGKIRETGQRRAGGMVLVAMECEHESVST